MARKSYATEEIIKHLRTVEIEKSKGKSVEEIARQIGVHAVTLAKWKREYSHFIIIILTPVMFTIWIIMSAFLPVESLNTERAR